MKTELKVALIGLAGVILAAVIGGIFVLYSGALVPPSKTVPSQAASTPTPAPKASSAETLSLFCSFVRSNALDYAYQLYSDKLKSTVSAAQFNAAWGKTLSQCTPNITTSNATNATGTIATTEFPSGQTASYNVTLIKDSANYWRIDSISTT